MSGDIAVIHLYPRIEECAVCECEIVNGNKGIAMFEGEPVPHDWPDEWGGFPCCAQCFAEFEAVQASAPLRTVWFASKRHAVRLRRAAERDALPKYAGDLV